MSGPDLNGGENSHRVASAQLRALIERIERREEDKKEVADDIKDIYAEGKALGYSTKMMRQMVRERKMDTDERAEFYALEDTYRTALALEAEGLA